MSCRSPGVRTKCIGLPPSALISTLVLKPAYLRPKAGVSGFPLLPPQHADGRELLCYGQSLLANRYLLANQLARLNPKSSALLLLAASGNIGGKLCDGYHSVECLAKAHLFDVTRQSH